MSRVGLLRHALITGPGNSIISTIRLLTRGIINFVRRIFTYSLTDVVA